MITNRFKAQFRGLGQGQGPTKDEILNTLDKFGGKDRPREDDLGSNGHSVTSDSSPASTNNDTDSACDEDTRDKTFSQSQSFSNSYCDEWERLFNRIDYLKNLRKVAMDCQLRSSRFRSVCWRVYLEVLPERQDQWIQHTRAWREQYTKLKEKYITLPKSELTKENNPCLNNPLSQDQESPWNKYFQDNELRITIRQDVIRTFPELEFFHSNERIQKTMTNILFCMARENTCLSYKQGMHELLAPIIFVLHCDHQAFQHACELESVGLFSEEDRELVKELLDPTFLEHDAFAMFSQIMETVEPWYHSREFTPPSKADVIVHAQPFMRPQDLQPSNVIVNKLTRIQDYLLKKIDLELYMHLERLDIAPQIYGIRWLRLLFGREFPMQDLLVVWDAIFANSICFDLVDYVFVAMLLFIRDIILSSDYPECLGILMRFPPVGDVHYMLELALHLRNPELYARPHNYTARRFPTSKQDDLYHYHNSSHRGAAVQRSQSARQTKTSTSAAAELASKFRAASVLSSFSTLTKRKNSATETVKTQESLEPKPLHKSSSEPMALMTETTPPRSPETTRKLGKFGKSKGSTSSLNRVEMTSSAIPAAMTQSMPPGSITSSGQAVTSYRQGQSAASLARMEMRTVRRGDSLTDSYVNVSDGEEGRGQEATPTAGRPATLAKKPDGDPGLERSRFLQGRVNDMESMCKYCASKMDVHIEKLQGQLLKQPCLENEDEVFLALAGIKQVRDVLKGTLRFAQNLLDSDEININDNHYTPEPRTGDLMSMSLDSSLYSSRRGSDEKALSASIFYVESPQESEKSFPMRKGDGSPSSRKHSEDELSIDMDDTIAKIMTLTRRDEEFTSSTELKDIENNASAMVVK